MLYLDPLKLSELLVPRAFPFQHVLNDREGAPYSYWLSPAHYLLFALQFHTRNLCVLALDTSIKS